MWDSLTSHCCLTHSRHQGPQERGRAHLRFVQVGLQRGKAGVRMTRRPGAKSRVTPVTPHCCCHCCSVTPRAKTAQTAANTLLLNRYSTNTVCSSASCPACTECTALPAQHGALLPQCCMFEGAPSLKKKKKKTML